MSQPALLFPGQGSQELGMGRDLAEADSEIMELWKKAEKISGIALREIYWDGDDSQMADTRNLQPALTVTNLSLWHRLSAKVSPQAAAGHSLGEFSAMSAAGVLSFETVLELVSLRGRLMSQADPHGKGAMAAVVKLALPQVEACVNEVREETGEVVVVANHNTPGQFVVSGAKEAMAKLQDKIKSVKGRALPLAVSGAFHSPLMAEAAAEFGKAVEAVSKGAWNNAKFPIYCNVSPQAERDASVLKDLMCRQMTSPVYWIDTISRLWDNGARVFMECGPKGVLGKMVGPILEAHAQSAAVHSAEQPAWSVVPVANMQQLQAATA